MKWTSKLLVAAIALTLGGAADADDAQDLAKQLSNPISSLISVPFQFNFDQNMGATGDGTRTTLNIQPVIPFKLNENWNLISRTIVPLMYQNDVTPGTSQSGFGDVTQSFFFSPAQPTSGGLIWGAGPAFLLPMATDSALGSDTFAAGITGVALWQKGPWTYGALANHLWDVSGPADINSTFYQPFVAYALPDPGLSLHKWKVPMIGFVIQIRYPQHLV